MPNRSGPSYVKAFRRTFEYFTTRNHTITNLISDNESSEPVRQFFRNCTPPCIVQFVAPKNHRANFAERYIRTSKNHIISTLATLHITFPLDLWDTILPFIEFTLNHLQPWHPDLTISAYHDLTHLPFDFAAHPISPHVCSF